MIKQGFIGICSILISNCSLAQSQSNLDSLRLDKYGKKHGWWEQYFTSNWKECKKNKAAFYRYRFYSHGKITYWDNLSKWRLKCNLQDYGYNQQTNSG